MTKPIPNVYGDEPTHCSRRGCERQIPLVRKLNSIAHVKFCSPECALAVSRLRWWNRVGRKRRAALAALTRTVKAQMRRHA